MADTSVMRDEKKRKEMYAMFPRKKTGSFEKTAARAKHRRKYRKDFKKVKNPK